MDTTAADIQAVPPHPDQKILIEFLESLHRIFKIGTYYPAGNPVLDKAVAHFRRNLVGIADTKRSVRVDLQGETLFVEDIEILAESNAVREFKQLLLDLGIGTLEIDRTIPLPELLQLVRSLLLGRAQLQGSKHFARADLADVPSAVRIRQKEFLVDENSILLDESDEDAAHGLNAVFQVLAEQGLDRKQIEQCRNFLNSLSERFAGRPINIKGLPVVSWQEVRSLLVKVITRAYQLSDDPGVTFAENDLDALSAIFVGLEQEAWDKEAKESINLLVSIFGRTAFGKKRGLEDATDKPRGMRPADDTPVMSVEQLESFIKDNFVHGKILEKMTRVDRREELSILLQLLQFKQGPAAEGRIRQNLRDILTTRLKAEEVEILTRGLTHLLSCQDAARFHDAIHFIAVLLRGAENLSSQQFLVMILRQIPPAMQSLIWPIVVNEVLAVGRAVDQGHFDELTAIAGRLSAGEMRALWPELETMDTFQAKKMATDIFDPAAKKSYLLFSFLLETSMKKQIGARVLDSLRANPPDWLIEAVAPLLQLAIPQHLKFLRTYLLVAQQNVFTVAMRVAAGNFVVHHLPDISEQQRTEAWVAKTILATPEMQVAETRPLLERIIEEKHMVVIPKWPSACRKAAAEALKHLKRKPLTSA
jgi:hypothetical protein